MGAAIRSRQQPGDAEMNPRVLIAGGIIYQLGGAAIDVPPPDRGAIISWENGPLDPPPQSPTIGEIKSVDPDGKIRTKTWRRDGSVEQRIDERPARKKGPIT